MDQITSIGNHTKPSAKKNNTAKKVAGIVVTVLMVLTSTYVGLKIVDSRLRQVYKLPTTLIANYYSFAPARLGASLTVNQHEFNTTLSYNSYGFRDEELNETKLKNRKVVLFLGDSFVEGTGVEAEERYTNVLVRKLNEINDEYIQFNAGQLATNPNTYFDNLITFGMALDPEIVVTAVFVGNDFLGTKKSVPNDYVISENLAPKVYEIPKLFELLGLDYAYAFLDQSFSGEIILEEKNVDAGFWELHYGVRPNKNLYLVKYGLLEEEFDEMTKDVNPEVLEHVLSGNMHPSMLGTFISLKKEQKQRVISNEEYENSMSYIREIDKVVTEAGKKSLIVIIPSIYQVYPDEFSQMLREDFALDEVPEVLTQHNELQERLMNDLSTAGIDFIDPTEDLKNNSDFTYHIYDQHMNKHGHNILAKLIFNFLKEDI